MSSSPTPSIDPNLHALMSRSTQRTSDRQIIDLNEIGNVFGDVCVSVQNGDLRAADVKQTLEDLRDGNATAGSQAASTTPAALPAGPSSAPAPSPVLDDRTALQHLVTSTTLNKPAFQQALRRLTAENDPDYIEVDANGTPVRITELETELRQARQEKNDAEQKLADERNPAKAGSLAHQLAQANTRPSASAGSSGSSTPTPSAGTTGQLDKAQIQEAVEKVEIGWSKKRPSRLNQHDTVLSTNAVTKIEDGLHDLHQLLQ